MVFDFESKFKDGSSLFKRYLNDYKLQGWKVAYFGMKKKETTAN